MLKIPQARIQKYMNWELLDVQAGFREVRGARDQIANIHWSIKKARDFQKTSISALSTIPKPLTGWSQETVDSSKRWEYQTTLPAFWKICMPVKKQWLEMDIEQTNSKLGKEYVMAVYSHSGY